MTHQSISGSIFLIGFMGSGKTTLGAALAKKIKYRLIDLDYEIATHEQASIPDIFLEKGEAYFRSLESEILRSISLKNAVIATGGGTPCFGDNISWMNDHGTTVYIKLPVKTLWQRLKVDADARPLLDGLSEKDLKHFIESLLELRKEDYESAHLIFEPEKQNLESLIQQLVQDK